MLCPEWHDEENGGYVGERELRRHNKLRLQKCDDANYTKG